MKPNKRVLALLVGGILIVVGLGLYLLGLSQGRDVAARQAQNGNAAAQATVDPSSWGIAEGEAATRRHMEVGLKAGERDPVTGRAILYYQDPMVPGKKFQTPGKSPYMDMMLVPVYGGDGDNDGADTGTVTISSRLQQNIGLRTAEVVTGSIAPEISAVGVIAWNERDQVNVQARALGYVDKLHVRATLDAVTAGQPLLEIHVPAWVAVQEEFLSLRAMQGTGIDELVEASRARMRQAGMDHIRRVESSGRLQTRLTIPAPISGVVTELSVREGMTTAPGMTLVRINGLDTVWANAEVPESQAALLQPRARVVATSPAVPGTRFEGRIEALLPDVDPATRTLKARLQLANPDGRLVPGMFVRMRLMGERKAGVLLVPSEAVIRTGKRSLVMLAQEGGHFRPAEVLTGVEMEGQTEIRQGLAAGERIVVSGQFLVESEASLKGIEARLGGDSPAPPGTDGAMGEEQ
jgi:Cu(I)/Ag(I) efflux system membrane fusion protein